MGPQPRPRPLQALDTPVHAPRPTRYETRAGAEYVVVLRAPSAARFLHDEGFSINVRAPVWASKQPFKYGRRASAPLGRSTSFVLTAIGLGIVIVGMLIVSNVWKTPTYNPIVAWDPEAMPADWEAGRQRYFTINWIQLVVTWAAFAVFILALSFL